MEKGTRARVGGAESATEKALPYITDGIYVMCNAAVPVQSAGTSHLMSQTPRRAYSRADTGWKPMLP
jgi:hypothetical protein